jgi:hypothetical protein
MPVISAQVTVSAIRNGQEYFTWVMYAEDGAGLNMSASPSGKTWLGIANNMTTPTPSQDPLDYTWSLYVGADGADGLPGEDGADAPPTYAWVKYADDVNGNGMSDSPIGKRYLGLAFNKDVAIESTDPLQYNWSPLYDNVKVGGRNFLRNTSDFADTSFWNIVLGDLTIAGDSTFGAVLYATKTATGAWELGNQPLALPAGRFTPGEEYTVSFYIKNDMELNLTFADSDGLNPVVTEEKVIPINAAWTKVVWTFTANATGNTPQLFFKNDAAATGSVYLTRVKLEEGNIGTDWVPSVEDTNQAIQDREIAVLKQDTQPTSALVGQLWMDTSVKPEPIWRWDGVAWIKVNVTTPVEIGAYTTVEVDEAIGLAKEDTAAVAGRTTTVEEFIADEDSIASKIKQSTVYQEDVKTIAQGEVTTAINGLDYGTTLERISTVEETAEALTTRFKNAGGVNLLTNSVGFGGVNAPWAVVSGAVDTISGTDIPNHSGFSIQTGALKQTLSAGIKAGTSYTVTLAVRKGTAGTGYLKVSDGGTTFEQLDLPDGTDYNFDLIQIADYKPSNNMLVVEIGGTGADLVFTSIMANIGDVGLQWSNAPGEVYNTAVTMDLNGITVQSSAYDGYTVMSPEEFSVYAKNSKGQTEKVLGLNKDSTQVSKLKVYAEDIDNMEIDMGTVRIKYINGGGNTGWAFIPTT